MGMGVLGSTKITLEPTLHPANGIFRMWLNDRAGGISWESAKAQGFGFLEIELRSEYSDIEVIKLTDEKISELKYGFTMRPNEQVVFDLLETPSSTGYDWRYDERVTNGVFNI